MHIPGQPESLFWHGAAVKPEATCSRPASEPRRVRLLQRPSTSNWLGLGADRQPEPEPESERA
eukprot:2329071-Rhodomonas_salina.1